MSVPTRVLLVAPSNKMRSRYMAIFQGQSRIKVQQVAFSFEDVMLSLGRSVDSEVMVVDCSGTEQRAVEIVQSIRRNDNHLPIILLSDPSIEAKRQVLAAIHAGASDFVDVPRNGSNSQIEKAILWRLIPKIQDWSGKENANSKGHGYTPGGQSQLTSDIGVARSRLPARTVRNKEELLKSLLQKPSPAKNTANEAQRAKTQAVAESVSAQRLQSDSLEEGTAEPPELIAIGSSTGGPAALKCILESLPQNFSMPIVCVQHTLANFTSLLVQQLEKVSPMRVKLAEDGEFLEPGHVYVAPAEKHTTLQKIADQLCISLDSSPPACHVRPAVDKLFTSVASVCGKKSLGIVLTGMGSDGLQGSKAIRKVGGRVYVQSESTCTVFGMGRSVAENGYSNGELNLQSIGPAIGHLSRHSAPLQPVHA
ncbi:MAG: chemotaxis protein CheB [Pirellulaceae bacterium]